MVSRYDAIKSIGKGRSKEFSGPAILGTVDNAKITLSLSSKASIIQW